MGLATRSGSWVCPIRKRKPESSWWSIFIPCSFPVRKRFGDVSLRLETKGDEYNPLQMLEEWNEDDPDYERTVFLKSKKEQLSYAHKNGLNIVTVRVHEAGNKQIRYTLFAMVLGILAGAVLKSMVSPEMIEMLNKNVVTSIRTMFEPTCVPRLSPRFSVLPSACSCSTAACPRWELSAAAAAGSACPCWI